MTLQFDDGFTRNESRQPEPTYIQFRVQFLVTQKVEPGEALSIYSEHLF
jgi:hypothetical protein